MHIEVPLPFGGRLVIDTEADKAESIVAKYLDRISNRRKILGAVANAMRADIRRQFAAGGDPPWAPLKAATILAKERAGMPALTAKGNVPRRLIQNGEFSAANILIRTGRLRDSWGLKNDREHVEEVDLQSGEITMGSKNRVAIFHQTGVPTRNLPRRAITLTQRGLDAMKTAYDEYLIDGEEGVSIEK